MLTGDCIESHLTPGSNGYCLKRVGSRADGTRGVRGHHRLVYAEHHGLDVDGPEMAGLFVCHHCDNRSCINIDHLFLGAPSDNTQDMLRKGRGADAKGSLNSHAKLTEHAVRWIRSYHQAGQYDLAELAEMFGVGASNIGYIVRRETWRHI